MRWQNWLYVRTYHDGFHLFPQEMLFDVVSDPHEQQDVSRHGRRYVCRGVRGGFRGGTMRMQKMALTCSDVVDPLWTVIAEGGPLHALHDPGRSPLPKYLERLERTGRADGAASWGVGGFWGEGIGGGRRDGAQIWDRRLEPLWEDGEMEVHGFFGVVVDPGEGVILQGKHDEKRLDGARF